ncbi:MAG: hypothetical protein ACLSDO_00155 [Anaerotruncus colihominis]
MWRRYASIRRSCWRTRLAALARGPLPPADASEAAALGVCSNFETRGMRVIRMGLQAQPEHLLAGPSSGIGSCERAHVRTPNACWRAAAGHRLCRAERKAVRARTHPAQRLRAEGYDIKIRPNADVRGLDVKVEDV